MKKRYAMAVDTVRCVGCSGCVISCKEENGLPIGFMRSWIAIETIGSFPDLKQMIRSERCNQCSDSPCVQACPTGASHIAEGGVVLVDRDRCTGCKACVASCPYEARYIHPTGYADKCTFCLHRVRVGKEPACVENCPAKALVFGDIGDPESAISRILRERRHIVNRPEAGTDPNVFFLI